MKGEKIVRGDEGERKIIEYRNVKYKPKRTPDAGVSRVGYPADAFKVGKHDHSFVYVEGYVKLKPSNTRYRHSWVFVRDSNPKVAYEMGDELENLYNRQGGEPINWGNGDTIPWNNIEYHGYEITEAEIKNAEKPHVLPDADLRPILEKITDLD